MSMRAATTFVAIAMPGMRFGTLCTQVYPRDTVQGVTVPLREARASSITFGSQQLDNRPGQPLAPK